ELASITVGRGGRIIRREDGHAEFDRLADGRQRVVSAVHSGGSGRQSGEITGGDSIGCTVIHGAWFAHFNESLRRAILGETDAARARNNLIRFTYSLIDPRLFSSEEIQRIVNGVITPATAEGSAGETPGSPE
ncbi:MAG: hypothetical protein HUU01_16380, partial [Saprospiraceae bacterium]|nr:hypothetical protein [Saprospiraceae bacterium]